MCRIQTYFDSLEKRINDKLEGTKSPDLYEIGNEMAAFML